MILLPSIFIILPIYTAYLGFTSEQIAVILAFNVILDPIVTASNVMANAALCNILQNVWGKVELVLARFRLGARALNANNTDGAEPNF